MSNSRTKDKPSINTQGKLCAGSNSETVGINSSSYLVTQPAEYPGVDNLSIALIGPDEERREQVALALSGSAGNNVRAFSYYPPSVDDVPRLLEQHYDVIIIELDGDPEYALDLVESIGASGATTVMVYSAKADPDMLVRCMRAGAREFLTLPFEPSILAESLVRAGARRPAALTTNSGKKKAGGRLLAFMGAKGGTGVTTLACNFAVALAREPDENTLLIDLDLPLGDAALNLGIIAEYSTVNALQAADRLDGSFLSRLLVKHSSGLSVLAAPGKYLQYEASNEAIDKLLAVARQEFDNVVVDVGARIDLTKTALFKDAFTVYLVTQAGIPELRNSNRLIAQFFDAGGPKLEVVINRYETRVLGISEEQIAKALTRPAQWKIPNDYASVKRMQINATPLAPVDSPISRQIQQMARSVTGQPVVQAKKKGFNIFG
ncbi:MAG TPA: AAA family ATPase [Terracidiphilus sp.]|nr:AAA family ATPase [Terracidiphilus sp.]